MKGRKLRLSLVIAASMIACAGVYLLGDSFERPAWPIYDSFQREFRLDEPEDVVFVAITQASLDTYAKDGDTWPWPRAYWGFLMDAAKKLGAKSVTFDIGFSTPSLRGTADDESFNASLKRNQVPVVMPGPDGARMTQPPNALITKDLGFLLNLGVATIPQDVDGIYRRMPALIRGLKPLGFAGLEDAPTIALRFYKQIAFVDVTNVLNFATDQAPPDKSALEKLRGRHWIVGAAAPGLLDLKPTPLNAFAPGAEIHATALANALSHDGVTFLTLKQKVLTAFILALLTFSILLFSATPIPALVGASLTSILGPLIASTVIWMCGSWFNPLPTLIVTGGLALITLGARFQLEWRERQRLAKSVENSMSAGMVEMIRSGELKLARFGERRQISIFFCDLSGFTTISETLDASVLVDILNMYLEETVELVFKYNGFVDKFIGDAVMALWGAPAVDETTHAANALDAALHFQDAFGRFREKARSLIGESANELSARVGVHTGMAIVGNIGSHARYNYTAIGDPVNLASRLEGLGKQYDTYLLISEEILSESGRINEIGFVELDLIAVKGKSTPTRIFTYDLNAPVEAYAKALDFYRHARFAEALEVFETIETFGPAHKLADRCRSSLKNGVPKTFRDGVWHFDEK